MKYKIVTQIPKEQYSEVLSLVHDSFEEHKKAGLNFTCSDYTLDDLKKKVLNDFYFVAVNENGRILGITSVCFNNKEKSAYENITAISTNAKGLGIGSALYKERTNFLISQGCRYLLSDTAVSAKGSVKWHIKKCHCRIVDYRSYQSTNYYSYVFREDFMPVSLSQKIKGYYTFVKGFVHTRLFFNPDGTLTRLGKIKFNK